MSLQLVGVSAGVAAEAALEGPFAGVGANVPLQFAHLWTTRNVNLSSAAGVQQDGGRSYLHAGVVAHGALERFLVCVFVAAVAHEFSAGHKRHVAVGALVRPSSCGEKVGVSLEAS